MKLIKKVQRNSINKLQESLIITLLLCNIGQHKIGYGGKWKKENVHYRFFRFYLLPCKNGRGKFRKKPFIAVLDKKLRLFLSTNRNLLAKFAF